MDRNPSIAMMRTETINDPAQIAIRPRMMSVNTALQVDLFAQANASRVGGVIYSGFGGQPDFVVGALHSWRPGHDAAAQAGQIITQVAHPSVRDGLREAGRELGFRV